MKNLSYSIFMQEYQKKKSSQNFESEQKRVIFAMIVIGVIVVGFFGALVVFNAESFKSSPPIPVAGTEANNNVTTQDGKQVIVLTAKGGYTPRRSTAKAGVPTVLRVDTNGTFDCSIAIRIPELKLGKNLPPTGKTDIDLGSPKAGLLTGTCSMGMYPFEIDFQS